MWFTNCEKWSQLVIPKWSSKIGLRLVTQVQRLFILRSKLKMKKGKCQLATKTSNDLQWKNYPADGSDDNKGSPFGNFLWPEGRTYVADKNSRKKNWFKVAGAFSNLMACFLRGTDNHKSHRQWPPRSRQVNQVDRFKFIIVIFTIFFLYWEQHLLTGASL